MDRDGGRRPYALSIFLTTWPLPSSAGSRSRLSALPRCAPAVAATRRPRRPTLTSARCAAALDGRALTRWLLRRRRPTSQGGGGGSGGSFPLPRVEEAVTAGSSIGAAVPIWPSPSMTLPRPSRSHSPIPSSSTPHPVRRQRHSPHLSIDGGTPAMRQHHIPSPPPLKLHQLQRGIAKVFRAAGHGTNQGGFSCFICLLPY